MKSDVTKHFRFRRKIWVTGSTASRGTAVGLFGPDALSIQNGKGETIYHLRQFSSLASCSFIQGSSTCLFVI